MMTKELEYTMCNFTSLVADYSPRSGWLNRVSPNWAHGDLWIFLSYVMHVLIPMGTFFQVVGTHSDSVFPPILKPINIRLTCLTPGATCLCLWSKLRKLCPLNTPSPLLPRGGGDSNTTKLFIGHWERAGVRCKPWCNFTRFFWVFVRTR